MVNTNGRLVSNWPFPSYPAKPWTPEQQRDYEQQQRAKVVERLRKVPDAPMIGE